MRPTIEADEIAIDQNIMVSSCRPTRQFITSAEAAETIEFSLYDVVSAPCKAAMIATSLADIVHSSHLGTAALYAITHVHTP